MKAGRSPLATALVAVVAMFAGCGPFFGPEPGPGAPEIDPPSGTYTEHIVVTINNNNGRLYATTDPDADIFAFDRWPEGESFFVSDDQTIRAYTIDDRGLRSPIARADYVITDANAPSVTSAGIRQSLPYYYGYDIEWDSWPPHTNEDGDQPSNPVDDLTDWWALEFAVFASIEDNIDTLDEAELNGSLVKDWHSENTTGGVGWAYYEASKAGERRYINVFVRDQEGNATGYGSVRMESLAPPPDLYLGRVSAADDDVWLNLFTGEYDPPFAPATIPTPSPLDSTYAVALADLNDDGFDDLVAGYETGPTTYLGWFEAIGNGSFEDSPSHEFSLANPVTDIEIADMDQDGSPDIIVADSSSVVAVYRSDLTLLFSAAAPDTEWITTGDINGDGFPDLVTADWLGANGVEIWLNDDGGGLIHEDQAWHAEISNPTDVLLTKLNQDDYADLVVAQESPGEVSLYYGAADAEMIPETTEGAWWMFEKTIRLAAADWNDDGWTDLIFANDTPSVPFTETRLYVSAGDTDMDDNPEFLAPLQFPSGRTPTAVEVADVNGDQLPDLIEMVIGAPGLLWLNSGGGIDPGSTPLGGGDETCLAAGRLR